eukprot:GFYU01033178.1.p1 GENE.GFYU01033178.1~~GFYU01033178.1.p1  ORF type:complete len:209 (-),score=35.79 GFYU01033178.1:160-786(-)
MRLTVIPATLGYLSLLGMSPPMNRVWGIFTYNVIAVETEIPQSWQDMATAKCKDESGFLRGVDVREGFYEMSLAAGSIIGVAGGYVMKNKTVGSYDDWTETTLLKRIVRFILALPVTFGILIGMGEVPKDEDIVLAIAVRYCLRYCLALLWVFGCMPIICQKIGLNNPNPQSKGTGTPPENKMTRIGTSSDHESQGTSVVTGSESDRS